MKKVYAVFGFHPADSKIGNLNLKIVDSAKKRNLLDWIHQKNGRILFMRRKQIIATLLAGVMVCGTLAACGSKTSEGQGDQGAGAGTAADSGAGNSAGGSADSGKG